MHSDGAVAHWRDVVHEVYAQVGVVQSVSGWDVVKERCWWHVQGSNGTVNASGTSAAEASPQCFLCCHTC